MLTLPAQPTKVSHQTLSLDIALPDGKHTIVHVLSMPLHSVEVQTVRIEPAQKLVEWCGQHDVPFAINGGFFHRGQKVPLGDFRSDGVDHASVPFDENWHGRRGCLHITENRISIDARENAPESDHLLHAGPILVKNGRSVIADGQDSEGFSAANYQFDQDITKGRYPRSAIGVGHELLWAVVADGRSRKSAGLSLAELAEIIAGLGAETALNLDGGGSATLVSEYALINNPRGKPTDLRGGRKLHSAITFLPR